MATTAEALALFDRLEPVEVAFLIGTWRGSGFPTGHGLDGLLETFHWQGKRFDSAEEVHPLLFPGPGEGPLCVDPRRVLPALGWVERCPMLRSAWVAELVRPLLPLVATRRSRARLRSISHRGVVSAAMLYDDLPIIDVFRRIDADTVLGVMDRKGMDQPFFFLLHRRPAEV